MDYGRIVSVLGAFLPLAAAAVAATAGNPPPVQAPADSDRHLVAAMRNDAELAAVWFADVQRGWAVGDRGAIWHTRDGGVSWHLQESNVLGRLNDVTFLDQKTGWAVGGTTQPYTHATQGVVLRTHDGGKRWTRVGGSLLPTLTVVKFFDAQRGIALGRASEVFPSGVFVTDDGGRSWNAARWKAVHAWLTGDFVDPGTGAVAGDSGAMAAVRRRALQPARTSGMSPHSLRHLVLAPPTSGWLVGDGGLVLMTGDLGQSWQTPPGTLTDGAESYFDFHAVAVRGAACWIAGCPGTRIFHTADRGRSWAAYPTGSRVPIRDLAMVDDNHGWAVGALGTILATHDGGRTWKRQREGGTRAAFLGIFGRPADLPLELFSQLSAESGYLGVGILVGRPTAADSPQAGRAWRARAHEAVVAVGGCGADAAWRFPVRPAGLALSGKQIVRELNRANDGHGLQTLDTHLVRAIRMWRPSVIFTHSARASTDRALAELIHQAVVRCVDAAGDPTRNVGMTTGAGLEPWSIERVYAVLPSGQGGTKRIQTTRLAPRLGRSLAQHAAPARGLVGQQLITAPTALAFRPLVDRGRRPREGSDLLAGISLPVGGEARRMVTQMPVRNIDHLKRVVQKHRNMLELLQQKHDLTAWLAQADNLTRGLDRSSAGEVLFQLGQQYLRSGRWEMAAETFDLLAERYPQHPLAGAALVWLLQYYCSGETAWCVRQSSGADVASGSTRVSVSRIVRQDGPVRAASPHDQPVAAVPPGGVAHAAAVSPASHSARQTALDQRWTRGVELGKCLERRRPMLYADPGVRFPLAVAQRNLGYLKPADQLFLSLCHSRSHDAWWACAQCERWLAQPEGIPPKQVWRCQRTTDSPHLDGRLAEPLWNSAGRVQLKSSRGDDSGWPATARLAGDGGYLYFAVECHKAPGATYPQSTEARPRDPDLAAHDRVDLLIDIDRDYATYYRLTVDHRGWTGEACLGDVSWNPTWYVAAWSGTDIWSVEVAIPWHELTERPPEARYVWAAGLQRVVPGVGFQSWTQPANLQIVPEGFGVVLFQ